MMHNFNKFIIHLVKFKNFCNICQAGAVIEAEGISLGVNFVFTALKHFVQYFCPLKECKFGFWTLE